MQCSGNKRNNFSFKRAGNMRCETRKEMGNLKWIASILGITLLCYMAISNIFIAVLQFSIQIFVSVWTGASPKFVNGVVGFFSSQTGMWAQQLLVGVIAAVFTIYLLRKILGIQVKDFFQLPHRGLSYTFQGCCWFVSCNFVLSIGASIVLWMITQMVGHKPYSPSFAVSSTQSSAVICYFLYVVVCGPILEEIIFRGYILRSLQRFGNIFALMVSSVLFGVWHGNLEQAIPIAFSGFVLGYIALRSNSLIPCVIAHAFNNFLSFLVNVSGGGMLESVFTDIYLAVVLFLIGCSIYFLVSYKKNLKIYDFDQSGMCLRTRLGQLVSAPGMLVFLLIVLLELWMTIFVL